MHCKQTVWIDVTLLCPSVSQSGVWSVCLCLCWSFCLSACPSVCLCLCLFVHLFVCLCMCIVHLSVCLTDDGRKGVYRSCLIHSRVIESSQYKETMLRACTLLDVTISQRFGQVASLGSKHTCSVRLRLKASWSNAVKLSTSDSAARHSVVLNCTVSVRCLSGCLLVCLSVILSDWLTEWLSDWFISLLIANFTEEI